MYKTIFISILSLFLFAQSVYALNLNIKFINENLQEAVLIDSDTGNEWIVMVGDEVEGWIIKQIKKSSVVIKKEVVEGKPYRVVKILILPNRIVGQ